MSDKRYFCNRGHMMTPPKNSGDECPRCWDIDKREARIAELEAEVARLRAALEFVASLAPPSASGSATNATQQAADRARAALRGEVKP